MSFVESESPNLQHITAALPLCPEQVQFENVEGSAFLLDQFGRSIPLAGVVTVGRSVGENRLSIAEPSVSRTHAKLEQRDGAWFVCDLDSSNGTYVDEERVEQASLKENSRLRFGNVSFFFRTQGEENTHVLESVQTINPVLEKEAPTRRRSATAVGLPEARFKMVEANNGGLLYFEGNEVQLTAIQYEFVELLAERMRAENDRPDSVRGFVSTPEIIVSLSWDTPHPEDNHLKQLVRRVRRLMAKEDVEHFIDSRHRFGYRLAFFPIDER